MEKIIQNSLNLLQCAKLCFFQWHFQWLQPWNSISPIFWWNYLKDTKMLIQSKAFGNMLKGICWIRCIGILIMEQKVANMNVLPKEKLQLDHAELLERIEIFFMRTNYWDYHGNFSIFLLILGILRFSFIPYFCSIFLIFILKVCDNWELPMNHVMFHIWFNNIEEICPNQIQPSVTIITICLSKTKIILVWPTRKIFPTLMKMEIGLATYLRKL